LQHGELVVTELGPCGSTTLPMSGMEEATYQAKALFICMAKVNIH